MRWRISFGIGTARLLPRRRLVDGERLDACQFASSQWLQAD